MQIITPATAAAAARQATACLKTVALQLCLQTSLFGCQALLLILHAALQLSICRCSSRHKREHLQAPTVVLSCASQQRCANS